jgi:hypothetical protein
MRRLTVSQAVKMLEWDVPLSYTYRRDDPLSSKLSARAGQRFAPSIRARLLVALMVRRRAIVRELACDIGVSYHSAERRFSELKMMGLVLGTGEREQTGAGSQAEVYRPAVDE